MAVPFIEGFLVSIGLIMAIGPQNAYVLRQGLRHRHVGAVTSACALSDCFLITLGVLGVGQFIAQHDMFRQVLGWGGVVFLLWFATKSVRAAMNPSVITSDDMEDAAKGAAGKGTAAAVVQALAFTFLNPWVYLDTMVLVGGVSLKYDSEYTRLLYLFGACAGSVVWFYSLGYGAKKAAPFFKSKRTWQVLDSVIAIIMLVVAGTLVYSLM